MTQFNLLPDVKLQFLKAQFMKRIVISVSILVSAVVLFIFLLLLLFVDVAQKKHINDINKDIASNSSQLTSNTNLSKILTIQNQLATLPTIEGQTPTASKITTYMTQLTPATATISSLDVDYTQDLVTVTGNADSLATVNQFVDTLKFTAYKSTTVTTATKAFSSVVLTAFNYDAGSTTAGGPATYTITFNFDPNIFSNSGNVTLTVPPIVTTRSVLDQPSVLFQKQGGQ